MKIRTLILRAKLKQMAQQGLFVFHCSGLTSSRWRLLNMRLSPQMTNQSRVCTLFYPNKRIYHLRPPVVRPHGHPLPIGHDRWPTGRDLWEWGPSRQPFAPPEGPILYKGGCTPVRSPLGPSNPPIDGLRQLINKKGLKGPPPIGRKGTIVGPTGPKGQGLKGTTEGPIGPKRAYRRPQVSPVGPQVSPVGPTGDTTVGSGSGSWGQSCGRPLGRLRSPGGPMIIAPVGGAPVVESKNLVVPAGEADVGPQNQKVYLRERAASGREKRVGRRNHIKRGRPELSIIVPEISSDTRGPICVLALPDGNPDLGYWSTQFSSIVASAFRESGAKLILLYACVLDRRSSKYVLMNHVDICHTVQMSSLISNLTIKSQLSASKYQTELGPDTKAANGGTLVNHTQADELSLTLISQSLCYIHHPIHQLYFCLFQITELKAGRG